MTDHASPHFVRLPAAALSLLVERCGSLGEPGVSALREAGRVAGSHVYTTLAERPEGLPAEEFWPALSQRLGDLQLCPLEVDRADDGLLAVRWRTPESSDPNAPRSSPDGEGDSAPHMDSDEDRISGGEAERAEHGVASAYTALDPTNPAQSRRRAGCHFATGLLGGVFSRAAGRPIAVLEVHCGAHAGQPCLFLVGSEARLTTVHRKLTTGTALTAALER